MFSPWFPHDLELPTYPGVLVSAEDVGSTIVTLNFGTPREAKQPKLVRFVFRQAIACFCIEESIFQCSTIPGLPRDEDFLPHTQFRAQSPVWRSSINYRKTLYSHHDDYRANASMESYFFIGQDYVVLVESIDAVDVHVDPQIAS